MRPTLRPGSTGTDVVLWQRILNVSPDGDFGPITAAATRTWQSARGLTPDAVVGPKTWTRAEAEGLIPVIPTSSPLIRGIDVSVIQGAVPWPAVAREGVRFAIMRCAVGNDKGRDSRFALNVQQAKDVGVIPGAYCFTYPLPHLDPRVQAQEHVRKIDFLGKYAGELLPAADLEWPPPEKVGTTPVVRESEWKRWGCTKEQIADWCLLYLEETHKLTGLHWLRYSYRHWMDRVEFRKYPDFAKGPLWLADYITAAKVPARDPTAEEVAKRTVPLPWRGITLVQFDGNRGLRLPNGVDADFNVLVGGEEALARLSAGSPNWRGAPEKLVATAQLAASDNLPAPISDEEIRLYRMQRHDDVA